jgi:RNA polymerase sigma factor for flagellar operon FliA
MNFFCEPVASDCRSTGTATATAKAIGRQDFADSLVIEHLGLVRIIASGIRSRLPEFIDFDDLIQAGTLGLVDAARKFSPEKQIAFSTYAKHRVRGAILDSLRQSDNASRQTRHWQKRIEAASTKLTAKLQRAPEEAEVAAELELGLDRLRAIMLQGHGLEPVSVSSHQDEDLPDLDLPTEPKTYPDSIYAQKELSGVLAEAVKELPPRHQGVLQLYYAGGMTMRQIGERLGVNESRICQIHKVAIGRLGDRLRSNNVTSSAAL